MSAADRRSRGQSRRRIRYVDAALQRWIIAVVALEAAAVVLSVAALHWRLNGLIEASLFRVHMAPGPSMAAVLMREGFLLVGVFVAANLVALVLATWVWGRRVGSILGRFTVLTAKSGRLDFSADPQAAPHHELLELAAAWRERERTRLAAVRAEVATLDAAVGPAAAGAALERLGGLLR